MTGSPTSADGSSRLASRRRVDLPAPCRAPGADHVTAAGRDALEALRVLAVSLLIAYHASLLGPPVGRGPLHQALLRLGGMGWIGTDLLLALAGFLAVGSRARQGAALAWLGRRAARVLPPFAVFLATYLYVVPLLLAAGGGSGETVRMFALAREHQGWLWAMAANLEMALGGRPGVALEPLLTLALGAQLTVVAALLLSKERPWVTVAGIVLLEVGAFALRAAWADADVWRAYSFPLTRCDAFVAGMGAAWLLSRPRWGERLRRSRRALAALAAAALLAAVAVTHGLSLHARVTALVAYPVVGVFSGAMVLLLSQAERSARWLRVVAAAGGAAYGVYLVKLPTIYAVRHLLEQSAAFAGASGLLLLALSGAVASGALGGAFHLAVERPLARLPWSRP